MPSTNMYRCQVVVTGVAGAPYYCVGYFDALGGTPDAALEDWIVMLVGTRLLVAEGSTWTPDPVVPVVASTDGHIVEVRTATAPSFVGTRAGGLAPRSAQSLISWPTGVFAGGRQIQGRTNVPCLLSSQVDLDGNLSSDEAAILQARVDAMEASTNSQHVVWSKKNGSWEVPNGAVRRKLAVLRSRRD